MLDHSKLPVVYNAKLPVAYEAAKAALAACASVDECKEWADKSAALASYAKQADDQTLHKTALRIQSRAMQRCGELLREIDPEKGGRPKTQEGARPSLRTQVATEAGLSKHQTKQALRVASVPEEEFEQAVESESPPTVTKMAELGTKHKPKPLMDTEGRDPGDLRASTEAQGTLGRMAGVAEKISPELAIRGAFDHEISSMLRNATTVRDWSIAVVAQIRRTKE